MIMDAVTSQDLQGESLRSHQGELMVWSRSKSKGLRTRFADGIVPVWGLKTQEEPMIPFKSEGWKKPRPQLQGGSLWLPGGSASLFSLGLRLVPWGPLTLGRAICFSQPTDLNVNLIQKHPQRSTEKNVWPNVWAPHGLVRLTYKINHHK